MSDEPKGAPPRSFVNFHVRRGEWAEALRLLEPGERHAAIVRWWLDGRLEPGDLRRLIRDRWADFDLSAGGEWQAVNLAMFQAAAPVGDMPLPAGREFRIHREQVAADDVPGLLWVLDVEQASTPAPASEPAPGSAPASGSAPTPGSVTLSGEVSRGDVLAYFTGRGRREVVVDPARVRDLVRITPRR